MKSSFIELQPRDLELFRGLFESRIMTLRHITALHFNGHTEAAKKRVQRLKAEGFLRERPRAVHEAAVIFLTRKAFEALHDGGHLIGYPRQSWPAVDKRIRVSDLTLKHELAVMDVKAAFVRAALKASCEIIEINTWPAMYQFRVKHQPKFTVGTENILVKPDAYIRIRQRSQGDMFTLVFFLELDRGTEPLDSLVFKTGCYLDYYKSGGYTKSLGEPLSEYKRHPFRVLMVFMNEERRNNFATVLLLSKPFPFSQIWSTTFDKVISDPFGSIWIRSSDYNNSSILK
jgi:hypothetical protein